MKQSRTRNKILQIIQMLLLIIVTISTNAYAATTNNIDGANAGGESSESTIKVNGGFSVGADGYRVYIADANSPTVISRVVDLYFSKNPMEATNLKTYKNTTWIGNTRTSTPAQVANYNVQDMPEPIYWNGYTCIANGENLKAWVLKTRSVENANGLKNATNGLYLAQQLFGKTDSDALTKLTTGDAKLIIEAVYFYRPINKDGKQILNNGQEFNIYGTIKNIAAWAKKNQDIIGDEFNGQMSRVAQRVWTTALQTVKVEPQYNLYPPTSAGSQLTYDEILDNHGYGIQIYQQTDICESTQTYDESLSVPGKAPKMPPLDNIDIKSVRPVTIVKLYTEKHTDGLGAVTEKHIGTFIREDNCRTIKIMNEKLGETAYTVKRWATSNSVVNITTWDQVPSKNREQFQPSTTTLNKDETVLYVWLETEQREPQQLTTLELRESEITRAFQTRMIEDMSQPEIKFNWGSMAGQCDADIISGHNDIDDDGDGITDRTEDIHDTCKKPYEISDSNYRYEFKVSDDIDTTILTRQDRFKSLIETSTNSGNLASTDAGSNEVTDLNVKFIIHRGDDIPTLVAWKTETSSKDITDLIGPAQTTPQHERLTSDYQKDLKLRILVDEDKSDLTTSGACPDHNDHRSEVKHEISTVPEFNGKALIHVYSGEEKSEANDTPDLQRLNSTSYKNGMITGVKQTWIKTDDDNLVFYPYIQMSYQHPGDNEDSKENVYILQQHISSMKVQQAVSIQWTKKTDENGYNMLLLSDQFSNHQAAISGDKGWNLKNDVLPGGAIYGVSTTNNNGIDLGATMKITGYYPQVPQDVVDETISYDSRWTAGNGEAEFSSIVTGAVNQINNNYKLAQYVDNWSNNSPIKRASALSGLKVYPGSQLRSLTKKNLKASEDDKYYLRDNKGHANSNEINATSGGISKATYTFKSDIHGNILMNGTVILKKDQGPERLKGVAKTIDDNTKVVTNLCNSLIRNKGNDTSSAWADEDGHWYNEMFDGIQVTVYSSTIEIGLTGYEGLYYRTCILDPNLCPTQAGTKDKFNAANIMQYGVDTGKSGSIGQALGQEISIPYGQDILTSRPIWIPNVTVQEND